MTLRLLLLCCPALLAACSDDDPWAPYTNQMLQVTELTATTGQSITQSVTDIDGHQYQLVAGDFFTLTPAADGATDRFGAEVAVVGSLDMTFTLRVDGANDQQYTLQVDLQDPDSAPCEGEPCAKLIGTSSTAINLTGEITGATDALHVTALSGNGGDSLGLLASPALAIHTLAIARPIVAE